MPSKPANEAIEGQLDTWVWNPTERPGPAGLESSTRLNLDSNEAIRNL